MNHDTALIVGYGLTALAIVIELVALLRRRRQARARACAVDDELDGESR